MNGQRTGQNWLSGKKQPREILRQIKLIEQPYRDKGAATAMAKLPEDIQAILKKPEKDRSLLEKQIGALAYRQIAFEHAQVPARSRDRSKRCGTNCKRSSGHLMHCGRFFRSRCSRRPM